MPRYNDFFFGSIGPGTGYYGTRAALAFSAEPITATAVGYDDIALTWLAPTGAYSTFRVLRNQSGFPQTHEDGFVVYESAGAPAAPTSRNPFHDTSLDENKAIKFPLMGGRFVFYRAWVKKDENGAWVTAGDTFVLLPSPHNLSIARDSRYVETNPEATGYIGQDRLAYFDPKTSPFVSSTHKRFLDLFPRAITSSSTGALDVPTDSYNGTTYQTSGQLGISTFSDTTSEQYNDENSLFPAFMSAFSFTVDEMLTFAGLITPDTSVHWSSPTSIFLGGQELGMTQDIDSVTATQRSLLRNAVPIYSSKGTLSGLELLSQSMTGYDAVVTETNNLLLSIEDSTFYIPGWEEKADAASKVTPVVKPAIGNWTVLSTGLSMEVVSSEVTSANNDYLADATYGKYIIDTTYCAKVTPSTTNQSIGLGTVNPLGTGIPVTGGSYYTFQALYKRSNSASNTMTVEFKWFDKAGVYISSSTNISVSLTRTPISSWYSTATPPTVVSRQAPLNALYLGIVLKFSDSHIVYLDMVQVNEVASDASGGIAYQEPRGALVDLQPARANFVNNPSLLTSASGWTAYSESSSSREAIDGFSGTGVFNMVADGTDTLWCKVGVSNHKANAKTGDTYAFSCYVKDVNTAVEYTPFVYAYDNFGARPLGVIDGVDPDPSSIKLPLGGSDLQVAPSLVGVSTEVVSTEWTRFSHTFKVPGVVLPLYSVVVTGKTAVWDGIIPVGTKEVTIGGFSETNAVFNGTFQVRNITETTFSFLIDSDDISLSIVAEPDAVVSFDAQDVELSVGVFSSTIPEDTTSVRIDAMQLEKGPDILRYFDGSMIYDGAVWGSNYLGLYSGDIGSSGLYPAKGPRLQRLQNEIADFIGFGTPFYVTLFDGSVYYKGFA
ncbi:hypothetical protein UFOVP111_68 [uncultured Caudovirales phage]|uniref:Carbohydrate-binding, CenC-like n=1 Tax=uncultured Caudovirales phage TaxID=2100421 RepID=A0A6J5L6S5_9CAUD|nr:hypothetical protein UFOVP111_68 [uncultured Caudovirales phage]